MQLCSAGTPGSCGRNRGGLGRGVGYSEEGSAGGRGGTRGFHLATEPPQSVAEGDKTPLTSTTTEHMQLRQAIFRGLYYVR